MPAGSTVKMSLGSIMSCLFHQSICKILCYSPKFCLRYCLIRVFLGVAFLLTALLGAASCSKWSPVSTSASRHPKLEPTPMSMRKQVPHSPTVACSDEWVTNEGVSGYCSEVTISYNSKMICLDIRSLVQLRSFDTAGNCVRNWLGEVSFKSCAGSGNRKTATVRILNTTYGRFRFELVMLDKEVPDVDICNLNITGFISFKPTDPKLAAIPTDNGTTTGSGDMPPTGSGDMPPTRSGDMPPTGSPPTGSPPTGSPPTGSPPTGSPPTGSGNVPTDIPGTDIVAIVASVVTIAIIVVGVVFFLCVCCVIRACCKRFVVHPKSDTEQVHHHLHVWVPEQTSGSPEPNQSSRPMHGRQQ